MKFCFLITLIAGLLFTGCETIKGVMPTAPTSAKKSNLVDTIKIQNPELITEVKIGKMQEGISIVFADGTSIAGGNTFTVKDFTPGWINPGNGFTSLFGQSKGKKCTIKRAGKSDLYGVMEFSKVYKACSSLPATRSYFINIPESYLTDATGGNITAVYEYYTCKPPIEDGKTERFTTWALWLSDVPF